MTRRERSAGISASSASTRPYRIPMSRLARSDWLGSSTSPPLIKRSNLSFGPMAARACPDRPDMAAAKASEPAPRIKSRREAAGMSIPFPATSILCPRGGKRQHSSRGKRSSGLGPGSLLLDDRTHEEAWAHSSRPASTLALTRLEHFRLVPRSPVCRDPLSVVPRAWVRIQEDPAMLAPLSRRQSLKGLALLGAGAAGFATPSLAQAPPHDIKDED